MTRTPGPTTSVSTSTAHRIVQISDTLPLDLNANPLGSARHVSGIADPFNGRIDEFRIAQVQRSDGWIEVTWNNMSDPARSPRQRLGSRKAASVHRWPGLVSSSA